MQPRRVLIPALARELKDRWEFTQIPGGWEAMRRPTPTAIHVICAPTRRALVARVLRAEGKEIGLCKFCRPGAACPLHHSAARTLRAVR